MSDLPASIQIKISAGCFADTDQLILQFIWRGKRTANTVLKEENEADGLPPPDFETCYRALTRITRKWQKSGLIDQWSRTEASGADPHKYSPLIFDKGAEAMRWSRYEEM